MGSEATQDGKERVVWMERSSNYFSGVAVSAPLAIFGDRVLDQMAKNVMPLTERQSSEDKL